MKETWFILEGGSSPDGRGTPKYERRTTSGYEAFVHLSKVANDPYSTGRVVAYTDDSKDVYSSTSCINRFLEKFGR